MSKQTLAVVLAVAVALEAVEQTTGFMPMA